MMDVQTIIAVIFILCLGILTYVFRKRVELQKIWWPVLYLVMIRTKLGLKAMDKGAKKFPKTLNVISQIGIIVGFLGMGLIAYELIKNLVKLVIQPKAAAAAVGLVLPFQVKGAFYVPFIYWIISIFIMAAVHEFSHGIISRLHGVKIKSSGFAFLSVLIPIIPLAFVEPDEKKLSKKEAKKQLALFAAGPFSNIVLGFGVFALLMYGIAPVVQGMVDYNGVLVTSVTEGYPAEASGLKAGEVILSIDDTKTLEYANFTDYLATKKPGDEIKIVTNVSAYSLVLTENPTDPSKGYMGITPQQNTEVKQGFIARYGQFAADSIFWTVGLLYWLYLLNIGIGLFNLVPLGPVD